MNLKGLLEKLRLEIQIMLLIELCLTLPSKSEIVSRIYKECPTRPQEAES